ncbi:MAG TPA: hypothetical protein VFU46_09455, partial [Gemmatimonadales bacterium]|nr:hypothetical protein [Gemmatimonadales bacterium]
PTTLPNVAVTLAAVNNNGTPANLVGVMPQITDGSGIASFSDLQLTKTGAYRLLASGVVGGRPAIPVSQATSLKFNIAPSK